MHAVKINGATTPVGAPKNWDEKRDGHCSVLWVRPDTRSGYRFMTSAWETMANEALMLLAGANIELSISAPQHPVVDLVPGPLPDRFGPTASITSVVQADGSPGLQVTMLFPNGKIATSVANLADFSMGYAVKAAIDEIEGLAKSKGWI
jgi:hypothetical protein